MGYDSHDRIGYNGPGAFDLLHIGHLNLLRHAKNHCNFLIVGVVANEMLIRHKEVTPVSPLAERLEIICSLRFVDMAIPVMTNDKIEIWKDLHFNFLFKGSDWRDTEKGSQLEREFVPLRVDVAYFPYTLATSSSALRRTLRNIDDLASGSSKHTLVGDVSGRDGAESDQRRNCLLTRRRGNKRFPGDG